MYDYDVIFRILAVRDLRGRMSVKKGLNGEESLTESLVLLRHISESYFQEKRPT